MTPLRTIRLAGELADQFGATHRLAVGSVGEAVVAIETNHPGFRACLRSLLDRGLMFRVTVAGRDISDGEVTLVSSGDVLITPVVVGASSTIMTVVGVVLLAVGAYTGQTWLMAAGAGMALGGVLGMMVKIPTLDATDSSSGKSSYVFGGSRGTDAQGMPVPVGCGTARSEGIVISAGIDVEDM